MTISHSNSSGIQTYYTLLYDVSMTRSENGQLHMEIVRYAPSHHVDKIDHLSNKGIVGERTRSSIHLHTRSGKEYDNMIIEMAIFFFLSMLILDCTVMISFFVEIM